MVRLTATPVAALPAATRRGDGHGARFRQQRLLATYGRKSESDPPYESQDKAYHVDALPEGVPDGAVSNRKTNDYHLVLQQSVLTAYGDAYLLSALGFTEEGRLQWASHGLIQEKTEKFRRTVGSSPDSGASIRLLGSDNALAAGNIDSKLAAEVIAALDGAFGFWYEMSLRSKTDDEELNLLAIGSHGIARACGCITGGIRSTPPAKRLSFDHKAFADAMHAEKDIKLKDHKTKHGWDGKDGRSMAYRYKDHNYRTWRPDVTILRNDAAILLSYKIDNQRTMAQDRHVVLMACFNREGHLVAAQASVTDELHLAGHTRPVNHAIIESKSPPLDDASDEALAAMLDASLLQQIDNISTSKEFKHMSRIARINLLAMRAGIVLK